MITLQKHRILQGIFDLVSGANILLQIKLNYN